MTIKSSILLSVLKPAPFGFGGSNPPTGTKTQRVTDHHWIILVLQGFLGIVEERALCDHLISLFRLASLWHLPDKQAKPWFESKRGRLFWPGAGTGETTVP